MDGGVAAPAAFFHNDFHHCGVEGVGFVDGGGAAFHVVDVGVFVHDDEGAFELAHVFRVDAEVRLEGDFHVDAFGDVDEGSAGPHCGVEGGEFVVPGWDDGAEVFLDQVWVFFQRGVGVEEDDALAFEVFPDLVVDDFGFVLGCNTGDEALFFRLGDAEPIVGVFDVFREFFPAFGLFFGGSDEVFNVVEVDFGKVGSPGG